VQSGLVEDRRILRVGRFDTHATSLASVYRMIDNAAGPHCPFVRRQSCMQS
jgi:hypothetical protein